MTDNQVNTFLPERRLQGDIDNLYEEGAVQFQRHVDDPARSKPVWLFFVADVTRPYMSPDYAIVLRENKTARIEVAIPAGVKESEVRRLLQSYIRDGYRFDIFQMKREEVSQ